MNGVNSTVATTTTIRIHHTNGDSVQRYANVVVNGVSNIVAFLPTADGNTPGTSVLTTALKSGTSNVIEFESYNSGWGTFAIFIVLLFDVTSSKTIWSSVNMLCSTKY